MDDVRGRHRAVDCDLRRGGERPHELRRRLIVRPTDRGVRPCRREENNPSRIASRSHRHLEGARDSSDGGSRAKSTRNRWRRHPPRDGSSAGDSIQANGIRIA